MKAFRRILTHLLEDQKLKLPILAQSGVQKFKDGCSLLKLPEVLIGQPGANDCCEEYEEGEGVVDDGGLILAVVKLRF